MGPRKERQRGEEGKKKWNEQRVVYGGPCVYTFLFPRLLRQDFAIVCYLASLYRLSRISNRDTILLPRMKIREKGSGIFHPFA